MENSNNRYIAIGLMLFALLFGAGNLIFPAAMGQNAGVNVWYAVLGFCVTGVGLPLISIAALGYSGCLDLEEAAGRVHPWYGVFYSVVSYLAIGPCFAAPRTGTVSFEIAVKPFLGSISPDIALPIFLLVFFLLTYWLAATPSKLVDRVGKILTPALLAVILLLIVQSFISPLGVPQAPTKNYATPVTAVMQGILDGYNTLDAIASFIFATLVISFVKEGGVTQPKAIMKQVLLSGSIAVALLAFIYIFIAKIGADSVTQLGILETGAPVLAGSAKILFGNLGAAILAVIVLLACLSTSVGLVTCCAAYFMRLLGHFSYKTYAVIFCVISYLVGLFGLKTIIVSTIPVLMFIYPLLVALICLIFLDKFFGGRQCVYAWTIAFTFVMATINLLETAGVNLGSFETMLQTYVPLHTFGMGWIPFAAVGFVIGLIWKAAVPEKKAAA
ncbi:MAG: branched-chain amino acid transport system II carrier protein [Sutterella sp.]|uniref:branched-chain amino acid transport system II carrier protein n=1 Tax=Dakarella massiliensis TaxID=1506471 RepID=UPI000334A569|nr:branched-chain amino acid transport system II carrier protein [Dakarella massiliensis]MBS6157033.1 branched-chain amino acid transport system II carrier protein [Sutterella sp.]CDE52116.1 branched-chain amino acid transport system II carrier protein [Sutterella sp. CAG:351]